MSKDYHELLQKLKVEERRPELYHAALVHASYRNEHPENGEDYDRLEFIGDGVLNLTVADLLYRRFPSFRSGMLSKTRSFLVKGLSLSRMADEYKILDYAYLSRGESHNKLDRPKLKEDMFEALIGAIYLDHGFEFAYRLVEELFTPLIETLDEDDLTDAKSKLQELLQKEGSGRIEYLVAEDEGTAQDKTYVVQVVFNGVVLGVGSGSSKKKAEQLAAQDALKRRVD